MTGRGSPPRPQSSPELRWMVRLEPMRQPRFGESRHELLVWAVIPYVKLPNGVEKVGDPVGMFPRRALPAAVSHARRACAAFYGVRS